MSTENPILDALQTSVIINRRDKPGQIAWTEWRANVASGCPAAPGSVVMTGAGGKIDPCLLPTPASSLLIEVNGVPTPSQTVANFIAGTNITIVADAFGGITIDGASTASTSFSAVSSGTNIGQTLIVGPGSSLTVACPGTGSPPGTGVIEATELATDTCTPVVTNLSHPTHAGMLLISQPGNDTAIWADPQVQGLYAAGSTICPAPAYVAPTCIQPVLIGAEDPNGILQNVQGSYFGSPATFALDVYVVNPITAEVTFPSSVAVTQDTTPWVVQDLVAETYLASIASTVSFFGSPTAPVMNVNVVSQPSSNDSYLFNGTTWDPEYNNWDAATGTSGTITAPFVGPVMTNYNARGAIITFILGTVVGTNPSFSPQLQYSPDGGTTWFNFGLALSTLSATGASGAFYVYPTSATSALLGVTQLTLIDAVLPRTWRINYTVSGTGGTAFDLIGVYVNYLL